MASIIHHIHKRIRSQKGRNHSLFKPYPHPDKRIKFLDNLCLFLAIVQPLAAAPQIYKIYVEKEVAGISILMWIIFTLVMVPFVIYGFVHKTKPMVVCNILWIAANISIIMGILINS